MEAQKCSGIYISKDTATVVCLSSKGPNREVMGCFSVSVEETEQPKQQTLATLIAKGCAERDLELSEVAIALDCAMFMQHNIHSEFNDQKQISATIRFDTEEALATDIANVAMAFKINSSEQNGSDLTVFTIQKKILSEILLSLQSNNIDPITVEPDVNCLSRFVCQNVALSEGSHPFFAMLSSRSGYFIVPISSEAQKQPIVRTFLLGPTQDRSELLARETPITTALAKTAEAINCLKVFDSTGSISHQQLSEKLCIEVSPVDLAKSAGVNPQILADCADSIDFAIAYGAALAHPEKDQSINFRNDFMPYQGKKVRMQKALKFASYSITILVLAVGLYSQMQLLQTNKYRNRLRNKFEKQYSAVMFGKKPPAKSNPVRKLTSELRRIRDVKSGQLSITGEESISAKLTLVLEAFNKCAGQTDLNIDSISITTKTISISGDTSSRANTLKLFKAIKANLDILQQRLSSKGGRDNFRITAVPKQ